MVPFFLWCLVPLELAVSTYPSTSCGCSGSEWIEVHHDEYLSQDCSDAIDSQSRLTIDAKGVRATTSHNQSDVDWTNMRGDVLGNFQYLGALRFPAGSNADQSIVTMEVLVPDKVPDSLRILFFSDQPASFAMIGRASASTIGDKSGNSCQQKSAVAKSFHHCDAGQPCTHGVTISSFTSHGHYDGERYPNSTVFRQKVAVNQSVPRTWHFVAANCAGDVDVTYYRISSSDAVAFPGIGEHPLLDSFGIQGFASGGFELLGTFCFFSSDATPSVSVEWDSDDKESSADVELLVYDEVGLGQLFDAHHAPALDAIDDKAMECKRRRNIAVQTVSLGGGSSPVRFTVAANSKVSGDGVRRLTFILSKCVTSGALRMTNVRIHAATAGDCHPREQTYKSCLDAGLAKPLAECTCESFSRAMNLDSSSFGKCVGGSRTRCEMFSGSVSTAISGTTHPNAVPDTATTATMRTTPGSSQDILTRSHTQTELFPTTIETTATSNAVTTSITSEHQVMKCACQNGFPASSGCNGGNLCAKCKAGFYLDANQACSVKECTCQYGRGAVGSSCPVHGTEACATCNFGFYLDQASSLCLVKQCECPNGNPDIGTSCPQNGAVSCAQCDAGFFLAQKQGRSECEVMKCQCENGIPAAGTSCPLNGAEECYKCDSGYTLTSTFGHSICSQKAVEVKGRRLRGDF